MTPGAEGNAAPAARPETVFKKSRRFIRCSPQDCQRSRCSQASCQGEDGRQGVGTINECQNVVFQCSCEHCIQTPCVCTIFGQLNVTLDDVSNQPGQISSCSSQRSAAFEGQSSMQTCLLGSLCRCSS